MAGALGLRHGGRLPVAEPLAGGALAHVSLPTMQRYSLTFIAVVLLLFALAGCSREPQLSPLADDAVILAFGDSLTYGTGAAAELSYPAVLEQLSGRRVINAGVPGEETTAGLERLAATLDEHQPQLLLLCLGGNDMLRKRDVATIMRNLEEMVAISRAQGVPVVLLGVPRPAIFGLESAPLYYELAERLQLPLEAEAIPDVLGDNDLKSDPIHPNAAGYRQIAEGIYRKLRASGAL